MRRIEGETFERGSRKLGQIEREMSERSRKLRLIKGGAPKTSRRSTRKSGRMLKPAA